MTQKHRPARFSLLAAILVCGLCAPVTVMAEEKPYVPEQLQRKHDRRLQDIKPYDKNKDGILDAKEQAASVKGKFTALDKNKDGKITAEEMAGAGDAYAAARTKKEPTANPEILRREVKDLQKRLNEADANKDGVVSPKEYEEFQKARITRMDKNGDGKVDASEYRLDGEEWSKNKKK